MTTLTPQEQELVQMFTERLPKLLDDHPELEPQLYHVFLRTFARKEEVAAVHKEVTEFREETRDNFARVNTRISEVDQRLTDKIDSLQAEMRQGFKELTRHIDRLGSRWGIRNESLFRETVTSILEKSFDAKVETRHIKGEQFDLIISNGDHILVEIAGSAERNIVDRLQRKRRLYAQETGATPARFIYAVASIHSQRAQALREAGIEVIEPEEEESDQQTESG